VVSLDIEDAESVATIRYSGDSGELTLGTRWQDDAEHPVIVHIEPRVYGLSSPRNESTSAGRKQVPLGGSVRREGVPQA
jgi:hypothetical protein